MLEGRQAFKTLGIVLVQVKRCGKSSVFQESQAAYVALIQEVVGKEGVAGDEPKEDRVCGTELGRT